MPNSHSKILWLEGMTLDPHHFQQWDRYQTHQLDARIRSLNPNYWGFTALAIDDNRLTNGEIAITECGGILPGGLVFRLPDDDPLPASRSVADAFEPSAARLDIYLCLPVIRGGANVQLQDNQGAHLARFRADALSVTDENTGFEERTIEVGRPNFQIRFGTEQLEGFSALQVASVVRSSGGFFEQDSRFIPSSLTLSASTRLSAVASDALELSLAKSAELDERRTATAGQRQLTPSDITAIGLLAAVNAHIPVLKNHLSGSGCHPVSLYETLLSLAGHLSAYSADISLHPREFPEYDHSNLTDCVNRMSEIISTILGGAKPSRHYRQLVLTTVRENLYEAEISEEELATADIILSAKSAEIPEARLMSELPAMIRIAAPEMIESVLRSYTRALQVEHTSRLPVGMPEDATASYFKVERSGPFWDGIVESKKLAVFVPAEFADVDLKLIAILRG